MVASGGQLHKLLQGVRELKSTFGLTAIMRTDKHSSHAAVSVTAIVDILIFRVRVVHHKSDNIYQ